MGKPSTIGSLLHSLRYMQAFLALADELNFSRAADRLDIAQQQLSKQISRLESELGVQLFHRSTRHVHLTPAGEVAYNELVELMRRVDRAQGEIERAGRGEIGRLVIAAGNYPLYSALPMFLAEFGRRYPEIAVAIEQRTAREQLELLTRGDVDIAFPLLPSPRPELLYEELMYDSFVALVRDDDPRHGSLPLSAFKDDRFLFAPADVAPGLREVVNGLFRSAGFQPRISESSAQTLAMQPLVAAGAGVYVGTAANHRDPVAGVRAITLEAPLFPVLSMAVRVGTQTTVLRNFIDIVRLVRDREAWIPAGIPKPAPRF
jgi:DNA-binding transcriptional LysR family regulator